MTGSCTALKRGGRLHGPGPVRHSTVADARFEVAALLVDAARAAAVEAVVLAQQHAALLERLRWMERRQSNSADSRGLRQELRQELRGL